MHLRKDILAPLIRRSTSTVVGSNFPSGQRSGVMSPASVIA